MASVNISQAARLVGKSRPTIHKRIKEGALSINDGKIETSDLIRVFGELLTNDPAPVTRKKASVDNGVDSRLQVLQAKLDAANERLAIEKESKRELLAEKDKLLDEKDKRLALLEHKPTMSENSPPNVDIQERVRDSKEHTESDFENKRRKESRMVKFGRFLFDE